LQVTGKPSGEDIDAIDSPFAPTMMESCTITFPKKLGDMFPGASPEALDLLRWGPRGDVSGHGAHQGCP
jgi:mitogen-activated protein kinase 15